MAHPENTKYLSVHVPSQLPEFTREDHATFVSFMEAYFEFLDQQGGAAEIINALSDYANIDKTVDSFVDHFKEQFLHDIPNKVVTDKAFLVKNIREFYRSRGSEKSFQFLFRTMWQEEITIDHPKDNILKPSDGNWVVDKIIKVKESTGLSKFTGKEIQGSTSNATAVVENIVTIRENKFDVSEMLISNIAGTFEIGETITAKDNDGNILSTVLGGMIGSVTVDTPGSNYTVGQILDVTGGGGQFGEGRLLLEDTSGILLKEDETHIVAEEDFGVNMKVSVKELQGGTIDSIKIVNGGTGYSQGDYLTLNNTNALQTDGYSGALRVLEVAGRLNGIAITNKGENYLNPPLVSFTGGGGTGAQAITSLEGGPISTCSISYGGTGYTSAPQVLIDPPTLVSETNTVLSYNGDSGTVVGFGTTVASNIDKLIFDFYIPEGSYFRNANLVGTAVTMSGIKRGDYFVIDRSNLGFAQTSITSRNIENHIVAIGKSFFDNVYQVDTATSVRSTIPGIGVTDVVRIHTRISGVSTMTFSATNIYFDSTNYTFDNTGSEGGPGSGYVGIFTSAPYLGEFSWGKIELIGRKESNAYPFYGDNGVGVAGTMPTGIHTSAAVQRALPLKAKKYDGQLV